MLGKLKNFFVCFKLRSRFSRTTKQNDMQFTRGCDKILIAAVHFKISNEFDLITF